MNPYPKDDVPHETKESKGYILEFGKAFWSDYVRNRCAIPFSANGEMHYDFALLRQFASGNQPTSRYKDMLGYATKKNPDNTQSGRKAKQNISWAILSPAQKYIDAIKGVFSNIKTSVDIKAIDEYSDEMASEQKFRQIALSKNKQYHGFNEAMGLQSQDQVIHFSDEEELDIILTTDDRYQLNHVIAMRQALTLSMEDVSNYQEIEPKLVEDFVVIGRGCVREDIDFRTNKVYGEYIDAPTALIPYSKDKNYRDINRGGHLEYLDLNEVRRLAKGHGNNSASDEDLKQLTEMYSGQMSSKYVSHFQSQIDQLDGQSDTARKFGGTVADGLVIPVLRFCFRSWNKERRIYRERVGNSRFVEQVATDFIPDKRDRYNVMDSEHECWYYGRWVVGTNIMLSWGQMPYVEWDGDKSYCPYKYVLVHEKSIQSQMVPTLDNVQISWIKFQDSWLKVVPPGWDIDFNMIRGIMMGDDTTTMDPFDVIEMKLQSGIGIFQREQNRNKVGYGADGKAFEPTDTGIGKVLVDYKETRLLHQFELTDLTGITQDMLGANAKPNQLNGVTQMLLKGTHNRLQPIFNGVISLKERLAQGMCRQIHSLAMFLEPDEIFYPELSNMKIAALRIGRGAGKFRFNTRIRIRATEEMTQVLFQSIAQASAKGILSESDKLRLFDMIQNGYYEEAQRYMRYRERKMAEMAAKREQDAMKMNADMNAQAAQRQIEGQVTLEQVKGEMEQALAKIQSMLKIMEMQAETPETIQVDDNQAANELVLQEHQQEKGAKEGVA